MICLHLQVNVVVLNLLNFTQVKYDPVVFPHLLTSTVAFEKSTGNLLSLIIVR